MRTIHLLAAAHLCLLPFVLGCASGGGAMGPGLGHDGHRPPIGIDLGFNYGFDGQTFTGEPDSTIRKASVIHSAFAINLPGDIVSIGATGQRMNRGFEIAHKDGTLNIYGFGPMVWVKVAPRVNVSAARVSYRTELKIPGSGDLMTRLGTDGPDITRNQVELNYDFASDRLVNYGLRVGYHWNRSEQLPIEGRLSTFRNQGPYVELVFMMY